MVSALGVLVAFLALRHQSNVEADRKREAAEKQRQEQTLELVGIPQGSSELRIQVPDGFVLSEGILYWPSHTPAETTLYMVRHPEATLNLASALDSLSKELGEIIRRERQLRGRDSIDRLLVKIPVAAKLTYTQKAPERRIRAIYNHRCLATWNRDDPDAKVTFQVLGFGLWKFFDPKLTMVRSSDDIVNARWLDRKLDFAMRLRRKRWAPTSNE